MEGGATLLDGTCADASVDSVGDKRELGGNNEVRLGLDILVDGPVDVVDGRRVVAWEGGLVAEARGSSLAWVCSERCLGFVGVLVAMVTALCHPKEALI